VVEQPAVNRLVAGSNPARGANKIIKLSGVASPTEIAWSGRGHKLLQNDIASREDEYRYLQSVGGFASLSLLQARWHIRWMARL
jgi:hypothetical protein